MKWDSDCVSGQTPGHKTPGGLYGLTYKKMHATLIGEDYETPVTYWMPFNGGIGLQMRTGVENSVEKSIPTAVPMAV